MQVEFKDYAAYCRMQNIAHQMDRINQAFADNSITDAELAVFVGERLRECGYTLPLDRPSRRGPETFSLPFGESGRVNYGTQYYSAERRADGAVIFHNGAKWLRAESILAATFESNASMTR